MLGFPKILHQLHLFEEDSVPYVADLDKARVIELSAVMMDILKLAETQTDDAIVETLSASYEEDDISEAFERFAELEREGYCSTAVRIWRGVSRRRANGESCWL